MTGSLLNLTRDVVFPSHFTWICVKILGSVPKERADPQMAQAECCGRASFSQGVFKYGRGRCPLVGREWALCWHTSGLTSGSWLVIPGDLHVVSEPQSPHLETQFSPRIVERSCWGGPCTALTNSSCPRNATRSSDTFTVTWAWGWIFWMCLNDYRITISFFIYKELYSR